MLICIKTRSRKQAITIIISDDSISVCVCCAAPHCTALRSIARRDAHSKTNTCFKFTALSFKYFDCMRTIDKIWHWIDKRRVMKRWATITKRKKPHRGVKKKREKPKTQWQLTLKAILKWCTFNESTFSFSFSSRWQFKHSRSSHSSHSTILLTLFRHYSFNSSYMDVMAHSHCLRSLLILLLRLSVCVCVCGRFDISCEMSQLQSIACEIVNVKNSSHKNESESNA